VEEAVYGYGSAAWGGRRSSSLNELTDPSTIGKRISEKSTGKHHEESVAANVGEFMEDRQCGRPGEKALIDAKKPEWRKVSYRWAI
jgi:hypothetical protein